MLQLQGDQEFATLKGGIIHAFDAVLRHLGGFRAGAARLDSRVAAGNEQGNQADGLERNSELSIL